MRRREREITGREEIIQVIDRCPCCRLGFFDGDGVYVVPVSFGWEWGEEGLKLYFHGATEGKKAGLIRADGRVGFEMDRCLELKTGPTACSYSTGYESIIGKGQVYEIGDPGEKRRALTRIMEHTAGPGPWTFEDGVLSRTAVFCVEAHKVSCKRNS